ncbi:MAG: hypothetical protein R3F34_08065 [Planctomycetota bacterium]
MFQMFGPLCLSFALAASPSHTAGVHLAPHAVLDQDGARAQAAPREAAAPRRDRVDAGEAAAQAGDDVVTFDELDRLLLDRHAFGPASEDALTFLVQNALIAHLAAEAGVVVTTEQVEARWAELDRVTREQGLEGGLEGYRQEKGVERADFLRALENQLRLAELTRRALGLPADQPVPEYDQQIWLEQQVGSQELVRLPRPWEDGVVARLGEIEVRAKDLALRLRDAIGPREVRDALFQLLLLRRVEVACAKYPKSAREAAVDLEVARRRSEASSNPAYKGVDFDALLRAQGLDPQTFRNDPAIRIAALSTLYIDTEYAGDRLRAAYDAEKKWFDDRFGESVDAYLVFVVTSEEPDALVPFTRASARARLADIAKTVDSEPAFAATAAQLGQDQDNGIVASGLGPVHREDMRLDAELRSKVYELYDAGVRGTSEPVELSTGVGLFYIGTHRPTPNFEGMRDAVHKELRRRFLVDLLPIEQLATYLDQPQ